MKTSTRWTMNTSKYVCASMWAARPPYMNSHYASHVHCHVHDLCRPGDPNERTTVHVSVLTEKAPQVTTTVGSPASQCQGPQGCWLPPQRPSPHSKTAPYPNPSPHPVAEALLIQPKHTAACLYLTGCWCPVMSVMGRWRWFRSRWMIWRMSHCVRLSRRRHCWLRCRCCGC